MPGIDPGWIHQASLYSTDCQGTRCARTLTYADYLSGQDSLLGPVPRFKGRWNGAQGQHGDEAKQMGQETEEKTIRDRFALKLLLSDKTDLSEEEVEFFRQHPEDIDEITAPVNVHKFFLFFGSLLGIALVIGSKLIEIRTVFLVRHLHVKAVLVDIVFEIGVALIGGGVTAYLLGILLNTQQKKAVEWRRKIRNRIEQSETHQK